VGWYQPVWVKTGTSLVGLKPHTTSFRRLPCVKTVLLAPNAFSGLKISHTCVCDQGCAPDLLGAYMAPPDPVAGWGRVRDGRRRCKRGKGREGE